MDQERYQYLLDIVGQALELSEIARDAFLQAHGEDPELLAEARDLLLHHRSDTEVEGESSLELPEMAGQKIGPYQIIRPLGEGGMGVVYLAGQSAPLRRKVALKVIKLGMGHPRGDRSLRVGAPGPGHDGSPEHRQGLRRGGDR